MKITISTHNISAVNRHIQALGRLFNKDVPNPYEVYDILHRAEKEANRKACDYCNGLIDSEAFNKWEEKLIPRLQKKLGVEKMPDGFFVNSDPRGYALKMRENSFQKGDLWTDFGGYGILAPDFS